MIRTGRLGAVDVGTNGRTRLVILPQHLASFIEANAAVPPARPKRKAKRVDAIDYFPGD
jgi:hypothetical protein